tara:strand:+ start:1426 stop:2376 length:951 start_codon:yes stop_codon:yes gene_type:complete
MIKKRKAFIVGLKGYKITTKEINFLKKYRPWGIILFSRNIKSIIQTQLLTRKIRSIFKDKNYPIIIDEEGGKVSRLRAFIDNSSFSAKFFGKLFSKNRKKFNIYCNIYVNQISHLLNILGINMNTYPVLDLYRTNSHDVIGSRSFSSNSKIVSKIGDIFIDKFHKNRIGTIIKHIPGHGHSNVDSHYKLPIINKSIKYLNTHDFKAFKNKKSLFSMTAHIIYNQIDPINSATHSKKIIKLIRDKLLFKNLIMSDDISMKALKFNILKNTKLAFTAGCNLVLHCNGNLSEMTLVAKNSPLIDKFILKKTYQFYNIIS